MSRYEQLAEATADLQRRRHEFRKKSYGFIDALRRAVRDYLECPNDCLRLFKPSEGFKRDKLIGPSAAEIGGDGYWRIGFALDINPEDGSGWTITYRIGIGVKSDGFLVRFGESGREIRVPSEEGARTGKMAEVCEEFHRLAKEFLNTPLDEMVQDQGEETGDIGFHVTD